MAASTPVKVFRGNWVPTIEVVSPAKGDWRDEGKCALCGKEPLEFIPCQSCSGVIYCSDSCATRHWQGGHSGKCARNTEALPTYGIQVAHLIRAFSSFEGTTADVGKQVRELTTVSENDGSASRLSYAELLLKDPMTKDNVKIVADSFVSHVHSYKFKDLMLALSQLPADRFVWIDIFSTNLHRSNLEWWYRANHVVISKIPAMEIVVDSWNHPSLLLRSWCVWEIYGAVQQGKSIRPILFPGERSQFRQALSSGTLGEDQWKSVFQAIDVQRATAFNMDDKQHILGQMRRVGVVSVNNAVMVPVRKWLLDESLSVAKASETGQVCTSLAALYRVFGEAKESLDWYAKAEAAFTKELGAEAADSVRATAWMADVLMEQGKLLDAEPLMKEVLERRIKLNGSESAEVAGALNNMAGLKSALGDLDDAKPLFERALAISQKLHGEDNAQAAATLNNLALLCEAKGDAAAAKTYHDRALAMRIKVLGKDHVDVAQSINNVAVWHHRQGEVTKAKELGRQALAIWEVLMPCDASRAGSAAAAAGLRPEEGGAAAPAAAGAAEGMGMHTSGQGGGARVHGRTSIAIFRDHLVYYTDAKGMERIDARGIVSAECYRDWLDNCQKVRKRLNDKPEKTFQRLLTACVTGSDGRKPFTVEEERAILLVMREKRVWPAFVNLPGVSIGLHQQMMQGFRSFGYHEKRAAFPAQSEETAWSDSSENAAALSRTHAKRRRKDQGPPPELPRQLPPPLHQIQQQQQQQQQPKGNLSPPLFQDLFDD